MDEVHGLGHGEGDGKGDGEGGNKSSSNSFGLLTKWIVATSHLELSVNMSQLCVVGGGWEEKGEVGLGEKMRGEVGGWREVGGGGGGSVVHQCAMCFFR